MNTTLRCLLFPLFLSSAALTQARIERVVEKTFSVTGAGTLRVEARGGSVKVMPGNAGQVHVVARQKIRADSEAEADELLTKLELTMEQDGNDVRVSSKYADRPGMFRFGSWPPVQVSFEVTVPPEFATDVKTSGGSITLGDLAGTAQLRTSGGGIRLGRMGGTVDARTSGGSIRLDEARAAVALETSGGNIDVGHVAGPAELRTSGGSIQVESVVGALQARTSGGNIRARITGPLQGDCELSTSGGSVRVAVDKTAAFRLDASTSGGSVDAEGLTLTLEKGGQRRNRLAGSVNGGGPLLKLRTSGGGIAVRGN